MNISRYTLTRWNCLVQEGIQLSIIMANKAVDTIRELRAISYKIETMRTETRKYIEEKDCEMKGMQDRINLLCTGLVDGDAAVLGVSHAGNKSKRGYEKLRPESKMMKSEPRESGFSEGGAGFQFSVVNEYTQVWTDGCCHNNGKGGS